MELDTVARGIAEPATGVESNRAAATASNKSIGRKTGGKKMQRKIQKAEAKDAPKKAPAQSHENRGSRNVRQLLMSCMPKRSRNMCVRQLATTVRPT